MTTEGADMPQIETEPAVLPQLERLLVRAAARQAAAPATPRFAARPLRARGGRRTRRAAVVALASLAAASSALAATGVWNPLIGDRTSSGPPTRSQSEVPAAARDALGVLRRAPDARDRGAAVQATLHDVGKAVVAGVRPDSIRYLAPAAGGAATILVSVEQGGLVGAPDPDHPATDVREPLCVYRPVVADGGSASACFDVAEIRSGHALATFGTDTSSLFYGLVPDGVASAVARFSDGTAKRIPVADNYVEIRTEDGVRLTRIGWRDAADRPLRLR
jgi:hypothetical protein